MPTTPSQQEDLLAIANRKISSIDEVEYLRTELQRKDAELAQARAEIETLENILQLMDGVFYSFQSFGRSLHETQNTYTKLTWMLDQEQQSAIEATNETQAANYLFSNIAGKIEKVSSTLKNAVEHMAHIDDKLSSIDSSADAVHEITDESHETREMLDKLLQESALLNDASNFTGEGFARLNQLVSTLEETVTIGAFRGFIELAKLDHLVFKFSIYRLFMGHTEKDAAEIPDHYSSRLGRWYYEGAGKQQYSELPGFYAIEGPHERLYSYAIAAVDAFNRDDIPTAMKQLRNMEAASLEFQQHLETLADAGENEGSVLCSGNHQG